MLQDVNRSTALRLKHIDLPMVTASDYAAAVFGEHDRLWFRGSRWFCQVCPLNVIGG